MEQSDVPASFGEGDVQSSPHLDEQVYTADTPGPQLSEADTTGGVDLGEEQPIEDPRVLAALERLADLDGLPVAEAVDVFTDVHARLNEALGASAQEGAESAQHSEQPGGQSSGQPSGQH